MCMYDSGGGWKVFHQTDRRAAKEHRCGECRRTIEKGETYRNTSGLSDDYDSWSTFHTCAHCQQAIRWLIVACEGYIYEMTAEDLAEHVTGHESYIRSAALTRLVRWQRAGWKDRQAHLRPVEAVRAVTDRAIASYEDRLAAAVAEAVAA